MATVYCKATGHNQHSFYISTGRREYYLFTQEFRYGVHRYYAGGVDLRSAMDMSKGRHDKGILRTMNKLPKYISYIEKEYETSILDKTIKSQQTVKYA